MYTGLLVVVCVQVTVSAVASLSEILESFETTQGRTTQEESITMASMQVSPKTAHSSHR